MKPSKPCPNAPKKLTGLAGEIDGFLFSNVLNATKAAMNVPEQPIGSKAACVSTFSALNFATFVLLKLKAGVKPEEFERAMDEVGMNMGMLRKAVLPETKKPESN